MKEVSISISIAGNSYPIKVKPEDEQKVELAARLISDKIKVLKETYKVSDKRDLLAMCALQLATQTIELEDKFNSSNTRLAEKLTEMDHFVTTSLQGKLC